MKWKVTVAEAPTKFIERLRDQTLKRRLIATIRELASMPRPPGCVKLQGSHDLYRVRVSDYRIIYRLNDPLLTVLLVQIGHRREVYR